MLNAAEAAIYATAEDDADRARKHAQLYAPPAGAARRGARRPGGSRPAAGAPRETGPPATGEGMSMGHAQSLMAQLAAEDARLARGR
ncbi:hypothetical protein [Streptomyces sp. NPDC006355]|uniref:hypothetical protein n=1 Tax=Streptomyces sp. NPDC006355 TaxID=3156758 RepID=UPI0033AB86C1